MYVCVYIYTALQGKQLTLTDYITGTLFTRTTTRIHSQTTNQKVYTVILILIRLSIGPPVGSPLGFRQMYQTQPNMV